MTAFISRKHHFTAYIVALIICLLVNIAVVKAIDVTLQQFQDGRSAVEYLEPGQRDIFFRITDLHTIQSSNSLQIVVMYSGDPASLELWYKAHDDDDDSTYQRLPIQRVTESDSEDDIGNQLHEGELVYNEIQATLDRLNRHIQEYRALGPPRRVAPPREAAPAALARRVGLSYAVLLDYVKRRMTSFLMFLSDWLTGRHQVPQVAAPRVRIPRVLDQQAHGRLQPDGLPLAAPRFDAESQSQSRFQDLLIPMKTYRVEMGPASPSTEMSLHQPVFRIRLQTDTNGMLNFWAGYSSYVAGLIDLARMQRNGP